MRLLGYLSWILVGILGLWGGATYQARWDLRSLLTQDRAMWKLEMVPQASISVAYLAQQQRWLSLPIPSGKSRVRIVSTGNLRDVVTARAAKAADPLKRWPYSLEIEITASDGRVLLKRNHQHRASLSEIKDDKNRVISSAFYLGEEMTPANSITIHLDLGGYPEASRLRIRSSELDPELADVVVRAYVPHAPNEKQVAILWQRLSEKQKVSLAKGSIYLPEMLIEEEKRNLIRNLWQPVGPLGAQGVDFKSRDLYVLRDIEGESVDEYIPPVGIVSAPGQLALFSIPEQGGLVRFEALAVAVAGQATPNLDRLSVKGRWYGGTTFARQDFSLHWEAGRPHVSKRLAGGLVELEAPHPLALRAFTDVDGKEVEITPQRAYKRLFLVGGEQSIRFDIAHVLNKFTPLRLEARSLLPNGSRPSGTALRYEFLDAAGKTLKSGLLPLAGELDRYDQILGEPVGTRITDVVEVYFSTPPEATQLRLSANPKSLPILVAAFNRPDGLPKKARTPEDGFAQVLEPQATPAWFALRPHDYERLIIGNQSRLIGVQSRPLDEKSDIQAGLFAWEDFRPRGTWLARQLFVLRDPWAPRREEALATTFEPLTTGKTHRLDFPSFMGLEQLTPSLIWINPGDTPFSASVSLDGQLHHTLRASGRYGEIKLPPLAAGAHELRVSVAHGVRPPTLFINHVRAGAASYISQIANVLTKELVFDIERRSRIEETFTARLFQPVDWRGRTLLRVRIEGPPVPSMTPLSGWIFAERQFDIRPDPSHPAPVFDTQGKASDAGRPVYLPFPADAPLGHYRLIFSIEQSPPAYLTVSRLIPGVVAERRILEEPEARHVLIE